MKENKHPDRRDLGEIMQRRGWSLDQALWFDKLGVRSRHTGRDFWPEREQVQQYKTDALRYTILMGKCTVQAE